MSYPLPVPFHLGCCTEEPRCALCPPAPDAPSPEVVEALIQRYREDRAGGRPLIAAFFGGAPPSEDLLLAAAVPASVRVRPDLLSRAQAERLKQLGVARIELDALTFDDFSLRRIGRRYRSDLVTEMLIGLREMGLEVGIVLAPGLPGSTHESCVEDARIAAPLVDVARIHPVLVIEGSRIRIMHMKQLYRPLELNEAIGTSLSMLEVLEASAVQVLRIGVQPTPDGVGHAVAGPRHTAFRQLVEARRTLEQLHVILGAQPLPGRIAIRCAPQDQTRVRGPLNDNVRRLRADHGLDELKIVVDPTLSRGAFRVEKLPPEQV